MFVFVVCHKTAYNLKKCNLRLGNVYFLLSDREFHVALFVKGSTDARQCLFLFFNTVALAKKDILRLDNIYFCCLIENSKICIIGINWLEYMLNYSLSCSCGIKFELILTYNKAGIDK